MKSIAIIGCPGSWKTTLATTLFSEMKRVPLSVELSCERARHMIAEAKFLSPDPVFDDQFQIRVAEGQLLQDQALKGRNQEGFGAVISDSSAVLARLYMQNPSHIDAICHEAGKATDLVIWSRFTSGFEVLDPNRIHDEAQCRDLDARIETEVLPFFAGKRVVQLSGPFGHRSSLLRNEFLGFFWEA